MRLPASLLGLVAAIIPSISGLPVDSGSQSSLTSRPSRYESTVLARRLLHLSRTGVFSTVFPSNSTNPRTPQSVESSPVALPDYLVTCSPHLSDPVILTLKISTPYQNYLQGSNVSISLSWWDQFLLSHSPPFSLADLPRASLIGYLSPIPSSEVRSWNIPACYLQSHPDAALWLPGSPTAAHQGLWMQLIVQEVYWIGGFGDRNFIGWLDPEEWRNVSKEEWNDARLPGERK